MSPVSTDERIPEGSSILLSGVVHTAGQCCQMWKCAFCGNPLHMQGRTDDNGVVVEIVEACESCDYDDWDKVLA